MKQLFTSFLVLFSSFSILGQEFESDLFPALNASAIRAFWKSNMSKMTVETYRHSKDHGMVEETKSVYRKGRINTERINFNTKYSEYYVVEDRKKSLGKYEFKDDKIARYERTDFNNRNARMYTMTHYFTYDQDIVSLERIKTKEYVASGSVDFDTIVYVDTVQFEVKKESDKKFRQDNLSDPGVYSTYQLEDGKLISKINYFEKFQEKTTYNYAPNGHLIKIVKVLESNEGKLTNITELNYNQEGLLAETKFYDQHEKLIERKIFEYK